MSKPTCLVSEKFEVQIPNLTWRCKRFATASTSTQVAVLPLDYVTEKIFRQPVA